MVGHELVKDDPKARGVAVRDTRLYERAQVAISPETYPLNHLNLFFWAQSLQAVDDICDAAGIMEHRSKFYFPKKKLLWGKLCLDSLAA